MPWELGDEHAHARQETWLLSFIDILALLLTLFVLLLAFQHRDMQEAAHGGAEVAPLLLAFGGPGDPDPLQVAAGEGYAMPGNGLVPLALRADAGPRNDTGPRVDRTAAQTDKVSTEAPRPGSQSASAGIAGAEPAPAHEPQIQASSEPTPASRERIDTPTREQDPPHQEQIAAADREQSLAPVAPSASIEHNPAALSNQAGPDTAPAPVAVVSEVAASPAPTATQAAVHTAESLQQRLRDSALGERVEVSARPGAVDMVISDSILFPPAGAALSPQGQALLEQLAAILTTLPYSVSVEGHTDNVPIHTSQYPSNWELSAARASTVTRALIDRGIPAARLRAVGYGDTRPRDGNDTPQARALNRRVTFVLQVE